MDPLLALKERGQFVWLDHISRRLITGGGLQADALKAFTASFEQGLQAESVDSK